MVLNYPKPKWKEGQSGNLAIIKRTKESYTARDFFDAAKNGGRVVPPGTYTSLVEINNSIGRVWMSDTPDELRDFRPFLKEATGHVLVTGLGLGIVPYALAHKSEVESVTVIEINPHVISLTASAVEHPKIRIIEGDAYTWQSDREFDFAWHDIWPTITSDNWQDFLKLKKHYRKVETQRFWVEQEVGALYSREHDGEWPEGFTCADCDMGGCPDCEGTGICPACDGEPFNDLDEECLDCSYGECPACDGEGHCPTCHCH